MQPIFLAPIIVIVVVAITAGPSSLAITAGTFGWTFPIVLLLGTLPCLALCPRRLRVCRFLAGGISINTGTRPEEEH